MGKYTAVMLPLVGFVQSLPYSDRIDSGPFAIAEINDPSMSALIAFYGDYHILRIRIHNPAPFFIEDPYCFATGPGTGLSYSINSFWADTQGLFSLGPENCGTASTGLHIDPTLACGPNSANQYCICVPPSSANSQSSGTYLCDPGQYQADPYTCEQGDLSGRYGTLSFNMSNHLVTLPPKFVPYDASAVVATPCPFARSAAAAPPMVIPPEPIIVVEPVPKLVSADLTLADLVRAALNDRLVEEGVSTPPKPALSAKGIFVPYDRPLRQTVQLTNGYNTIFRVIRDPRLPPVSMLRGKSIVFSCARGTRIACAKLQFSEAVRFEQARHEVLGRLAHHAHEGIASAIDDLIGEPLRKAETMADDIQSGMLRRIDALSRPSEVAEGLTSMIVDLAQNWIVGPAKIWWG